MESSSKNQNQTTPKEEQMIVENEDIEQLMKTLPKVTNFLGGITQLVQYQGFWFPDHFLSGVISFQRHFRARDSDLIIATYPKTGTTWLKALLFAILNRQSQNQSLLLENNPHELVHNLEKDIYDNAIDHPRPHHLDQLPLPRLFSTHLPYTALPESVKTSGCRILCVGRNPLDTFVSFYHFLNKAKKKELREDYYKFQVPTIQEFFEQCCYEGECPFGPFFDHVGGYWKQSLEQPNKMMFLMYEDLKEDPVSQVRRIGEFIGFPFSAQEETEGVIEEIINLCSFNNLKDLEVNKSTTGIISHQFEKRSYFRKGEVGDWAAHFTLPMMDRLMKFMEGKIGGTGLYFKFISN